MEFSYNTVYGLSVITYTRDPAFAMLYKVYLAIATMGISGGMAIYGSWLYLNIKKTEFEDDNNMSNPLKRTMSLVTTSITLFGVAAFLAILLALNNSTSPRASIATINITHVLELTLVLELLYLMQPKFKYKYPTPSPTSPLSNPKQKGGGMQTNEETNHVFLEKVKEKKKGVQLEVVTSS